MEIGKTDTSGISATVRTLSATTTASTTSTNQTTSASQNSGTGGSATSSKYYPPATGSLRTQSPAILTESQDDSLSKLNTDTFAQMVAEKTKAFSKTLTDAFKAANIPTDEPIVLRIDGAGRVTSDSAYKKRIDKLFEENPELEKQFKDVAALNSLVALNQAMRRYSESKKKAQNDDEHDQASADYLRDCLSIQMRSDTMTLADGALTSPAMTYMATGR